VDEDPLGSLHLIQPTNPTVETTSLTNGTGSHTDNNFLGFNGSVAGGSNIQSMMNDAHPSDNHTLATSVNPLSGIQNKSQMESSWSSHTPNAFLCWPPPMISQASPLPYRAGSALRACAACDARLVTLRNHIRAIPDAAIVMQLLEDYFGLRDNWHGCQQGFGGLDG